MNKKWFEVLIDRADQYLKQYNNTEVNSHLQDSIICFEKLEEKLTQSQELLKIKKNYVTLGIYWGAVGDVLNSDKAELTGMEQFWVFAQQIGLSQQDVTEISNIILSRSHGLLSKREEAKILQDVHNIAFIGKNTWNRILTDIQDDSKAIEQIDLIGKNLNYQSSQALFEEELISRLKYMHKYVQGLVSKGEEE